MKKLLSVLLSVIMIFSLVSVGVTAVDEGEELKITVVNDLHYNLSYGNYTGSAYKDEPYSHVPGNGQLWIESLIIIETFFEEIAKNDSEIILMPGDLVDHGIKTEHVAFSARLAKFEADTGKKVYVVPGNHDYYGKDKTSPADFANYYAAFGYSEAIAKDTNSASYVVDLNDEYRLLAVDSCVPGAGNAGIDEDRKAWIVEQAEKAQNDGKKLISMMHHNLLDHFIFGSVVHPGGFVESSVGLPEVYAQYNIKYNFVGHTHAHDIKAYTGENGVTVYDVLTSSLNLYPLPYRTVTFGKEVKIETEIIETIDMTSKEGIISDECYNLATEDFQAYALECAEYGLNEVLDSYLEAEKITDLLKLNPLTDSDLFFLVHRIVPGLKKLIDMPLYETGIDGESLEKYANEINIDFPETDLYSFRDLIVFLYQQYVEGDENYGLFSAEFVLLTAALKTILNNLLSDVSGEDYASLLNYLANYFNLRSVNSFNSYVGDAATKMKGIDIFVSALANTVLLHFSTDELPADNNVTLPGYDEVAVNEDDLSFFDKFINFFLSIFSYILRVFGIGE